MTSNQYRDAIEQLGLTQAAAARLLGVDTRTSKRWANDERTIPGPVERFLKYLIARKTSGAAAMRLLDGE
jgi:DNA-binding transcriptional regulator YiaG